MKQEHRSKIANGRGFLAALDQSGGSTPKALAQYGVPESGYATGDEMFDLMHEFRSRIITAPAFNGDRVLGAILFEQTMDRDVAGTAAPLYLWEHKQVVPFVKVDEGLADEKDGVRLMKPFTKLDDLLARATGRRALARNHGLSASFSRALTQDLRRQDTDEEFNRALDTSIAGIYRASTT